MLPVFFHGRNSRLFHAAGRIHQTLRYALLLHEARNKIGTTLAVAIGDPIPNDRLRRLGDRHAVTDYLRQRTLGLAGESRPTI